MLSFRPTKQTSKNVADTTFNKNEFHTSKQLIALNLVKANKIVISDIFKQSDDGSKFFIGYLHGDDAIIMMMMTFVYYFTSNEWIHKTF